MSQQRAIERRGGRVRRARLAIYAVMAVAAAAVPAASASAALTAPNGLHAFQLRVGDSKGPTPSFSRTPSFAWNPVRGAVRYQFELAATKRFRAGNAVIWSGKPVITPATAVPISLPWLKDRPLYWRVRAFGGDAVSEWSTAAKFRLRADKSPSRLAGGPGYVRWSPVAGANGYQVSFRNLGRVISTTSTVADLRDYAAAGAPDKVVWRVRAMRRLLGSDRRTLPARSYGPWSTTYASGVSIDSPEALRTVFPGGEPSAHGQMPVFLFPARNRSGLHRVYIAKDPACKNVILGGTVVHGSAFAPRAEAWAKAAAVDLPNGRYYWTAVAVERRGDGTFRDLEDTQAACRVAMATFVRGANGPAVGRATAPFATGLSAVGRAVSSDSRGSFYGSPVVSWQPVSGARKYEVQWSRSEDPWRTVESLRTYATAATLPLKPGTWWYRVRGINGTVQDGRLTWSAPVRVSIAAPMFTVVES